MRSPSIPEVPRPVNLATLSTWEERCDAARYRAERRSPLVKRMADVAAHYNGDWVIPLPGTEGSLTDPLGPWLLAEAIDTSALRASTTLPAVLCMPIDPNKHEGVRSAAFARTRAAAVSDALRRAQSPLILSKTFRHLAAYAGFAYAVDHNPATGQPDIRVLDPLTVYPEDRSDTDMRPQNSVALMYKRTGHELVAAWGSAVAARVDTVEKREATWDVLEWHDGDVSEFGVMGATFRTSARVNGWPTVKVPDASFRIAAWPNRTGMCPIVVGSAVSLTGAVARLASFTGQVEIMARLTALVMRATERSVFPDLYLVGREGEVPQIAGGSWKEGTTGEINVLANVADIGQLRNTPDPTGMQFIDRLERNFRVSLGQSSLLSGESGSNALRTGRGIAEMMGVSSDPRIAEMQQIQASALNHVGTLVLECYKAYSPNRRFVVKPTSRSIRGRREFEPAVHVEETEVHVFYPFQGSDLDAQTIRIGQMLGTGLISRETARALHPYVDDATDEGEMILAEQIDEALAQSIIARAADPAGGIPPVDMARIAQLVREGMGLAEAVVKVDEEARKRQATEAPPPPEGMVADPSTMMGLGMPGEGQQAAPPGADPGVLDPLQDFSSLARAGRVPYGGSTGPLG